jgi:hypothetical protein
MNIDHNYYDTTYFILMSWQPMYIQVCYVTSFCFKFLFVCMLVGMCTVIHVYIIGALISFWWKLQSNCNVIDYIWKLM